MLKLLIADGSEEFRLALADTLQSTYTLRISQEGMQTLELLQSFRPDVLVLDLMLPGLDGITLLQEISQMGLRPVILATTRFSNDYVLERAAQLGVGYVMIKPCGINATVSRIEDLVSRADAPAAVHKDPRTAAGEILLSLGIPTKLRGYNCLREALLQAMCDPDQPVTKELYPAVAAICGGNAAQVERSIRCAIQAAWTSRDEQLWRRYFKAGCDGTVPRPTNAAFISRLAEQLISETGGMKL